MHPFPCRFSSVQIVQSANLRERDHLPVFRLIRCPWFRAVLVQRQMSAATMVVVEMRFKDSTQMRFVEDYHVIQAVSTD